MTERNYYTDTVSAFRQLQTGGACRWPRATYDPHDLLPHRHEAIRAAFYRAARRDGLAEDEADEAASWGYCRWLARDYRHADIGRGDHLRAYAAIRRFAVLSRWQGFTGARRASRRKITEGHIARRERMREQHQPRPDSMSIVADRLTSSHWSRKLVMRLTTLAQIVGAEDVDSLLRMAAGLDLPPEDVTH